MSQEGNENMPEKENKKKKTQIPKIKNEERKEIKSKSDKTTKTNKQTKTAKKTDETSLKNKNSKNIEKKVANDKNKQLKPEIEKQNKKLENKTEETQNSTEQVNTKDKNMQKAQQNIANDKNKQLKPEIEKQNEKLENKTEETQNSTEQINTKDKSMPKAQQNISNDKNKQLEITNKNQETRIEKVNKPKKTKKIIAIILGIIILIFAIFSVIFSLININNKDIISGVSIDGIDVSGMSEDEARQNINKITTEKLLKKIKLSKDDYELEINPEDIEATFDVDKAIEEAYNIGRSGNIITNNYEILMTKICKKNIELDFNLNQEELSKIISDASLKLPNTVVQSSYYIDEDKLIITKGTEGDKIKEEELETEIYQSIKNLELADIEIEIPTETVQPDPIDLEKIREEIYKEPQDAYVTKNPTEVHTHVNGVDFDISIEEAEKLLEEDKTEYTIPLKITIANKTIADLGEEAFPDQLSTFTTRYDASNKNRSTNIELASKTINGTVIMPGEVFSYNQTLGQRTIEKGYKEGTAYVGGKVVADVGGGICQVSSTLYNTALLANLEITERSNHLFECSYVDPSRDATVYWGAIDFKFKNTRSYPIKIVSYAKNGVVKIDLYGIKEDEEYEVVIESEIISYISNKTEYQNDDTLAKGKQVVEQKGFNGCKSKGYRILKKNGVIISKTLLSTDTYSPQNKIIKVGTKE